MNAIYSKLISARTWCVVGVFLAVLLFFAPASFGQGMATLSGKVADTQGALIPSAVVTATQANTGTKTVVNSNASGQYVFPSLPPASYSISVVAPAFKTFSQVGILLQADQSVTVDVTLQPGQTSETVIVSANTAQVDTTTATLSSVIGQRNVEDLPLNGRNAALLTEEVPGVIQGPVDNNDQGPQKAFPAALTVSVNGARSADTNYMFDGGNNIDELYSLNLPFPFPDALQEFSIQTNNYDAEYGQNAGGVVNIISKSGGEAFHGDLFEFVRNGVFNASNFFSSTVDPLKRNQFGGTLGGPVEIPRLGRISHSFFFVGYQKTILHDKQGGVGSFIATQANLNGDFSALENASDPDNPLRKVVQINNPFTGQPYAGDQIDPSTFNPAAVAITKALPSVTGNGAIFYQNPLIQTYNEILVRGDQDLGSADHVVLHFYRNSFHQAGVYDSANLLTYSDQSTIPVLSALASERHTFSPNLLNSLVVNYSREVSTRGPISGVPSLTDFGVNIPQPPVNALAGFSVSGFFSFGSNAQATFSRNNYTLSDDVNWVKGRHSMSFGVHAELSKADINSNFNNSGTVSFNANGSNYALASFLLGYIFTFNQGNGQYLNDRDQFYGFYGQDSWRATNKLTLNYGVRYEPYKPWAEIHHKLMEFDPAAYAAGRVSTVYPLAPPGLLFPGDAGVPEQGANPNYKNVMPRVGFAYDARGDGKLSIRGGAGFFYDTRQAALFNQTPSEVTPFSTSVTLTNPQGNLSNPYEGLTDPFIGPPQPPSSYVFPLPLQVDSYNPSGVFPVQLTYDYNLTLQQQLSSSTTMTIAYAGSHSSHMFYNDDYNPSTYIPGSKLGTNARRIYQGYSDIDIVNMGANGSYNSLQASIQHHVSNGQSVALNYTWSKSMDTLPYLADNWLPSSGPGAPYAIPIYAPDYKQLDIGPSDFDRTNVFSGYYVLQTPKLARSNRFVRTIVNNWATTGIIQAQSGQPITVTAGSDISKTALQSDRAVWNGQRPYGSGACSGSKVPCKDYLNPANFSLPAAGTFGNVVKGSFRGPGYFDWDASLSRSFPFLESKAFEFKVEYFNVINRDNLNNPNTTLQAGGFGAISSKAATESQISPRVAQFSAKIVF